jgi:hypothetical protein
MEPLHHQKKQGDASLPTECGGFKAELEILALPGLESL